MSAGSTDVTVVVPTYCEAENLPLLIPRIAHALTRHNLRGEILVVDDNSPDNTIAVCQQLACNHPVRLVTRSAERGLSSAVVCGFRQARGSVLVVMDADLSHPPEVVPKLVHACQSPAVDFVIGSRYVQGGSVDPDWGQFRRFNSLVASWLARGLTRAKDPMSGFFAIKKQTFFHGANIRPLGYKIGLELIVRCRCKHLVEIPITFRDRTLGDSKLGLRQQWLYLRQLGRLYAAKCYWAATHPPTRPRDSWSFEDDPVRQEAA